jgi:hypothetical protein
MCPFVYDLLLRRRRQNFVRNYYATGWTTQESGFNSKQNQDTLLFSVASILALWEIQNFIKWILAPISPEVKQTGHEAGPILVPQFSVEVKRA